MRDPSAGTKGGLFFADSAAEKVFLLGMLLSLPAALWKLESANLLPSLPFFGST